MIRGLYDAGSTLQLAGLHHEILAENLANVNTPGYRRHDVSFEKMLQPDRTGTVTNERSYTSFETGPVQQTGAPFDLALAGDAFFTLEGPRGPVYTRNGSFTVNAQGELRTRNGLRVSGQGGGIVVPPDAREVVITSEGAIMADGAEVGRLKLARFENPQALRRVGNTLFEGAPRGRRRREASASSKATAKAPTWTRCRKWSP
ncbi:MAG: flagellar hook basal-body protein [Gemmataceae bacterium]